MKKHGIGAFLESPQGILIMSYVYNLTFALGLVTLVLQLTELPGRNELSIVMLNTVAVMVTISAFAYPPQNPLGLKNQKVYVYFDNISLAILLLGLNFKMMHWPGCNQMIIVGLWNLSLSAVLKSFFSRPAESKAKLWITMFYLAQAVAIMGLLFVIMRWPGCNEMILTACGALLVMAIVYPIATGRGFETLVETISARKAALVSIAFVLFFTSFLTNRRIVTTIEDYGKGQELKTQISQLIYAGDLSKQQLGNNKTAQRIDAEAGLVIGSLEELKTAILEAAGEANRYLIATPYDVNKPLNPSELNFYNLGNKNDRDNPMRVFGTMGFDPDKPIDNNSALKTKLWNPYVNFQNRLLELCGTYNDGTRQYSIKAGKDMLDSAALGKLFKTQVINESERGSLAAMVLGLSLSPIQTDNEGDIQKYEWLYYSFDHAPIIKALGKINELELNVIRARADALALLAQRKLTH